MFVWFFPDFGKNAGTPRPPGVCPLFWVGGWVGGLLSLVDHGIAACICVLVAGVVCALTNNLCKNNISIRLTSP